MSTWILILAIASSYGYEQIEVVDGLKTEASCQAVASFFKQKYERTKVTIDDMTCLEVKQ